MGYDTTLLKGQHDISILISDQDLIHRFMVEAVHNVDNRTVTYEISRSGGELIARPWADLQVLEETNNNIMRILIRTYTHLFEILPKPGTGRWIAYKSNRKN